MRNKKRIAVFIAALKTKKNIEKLSNTLAENIAVNQCEEFKYEVAAILSEGIADNLRKISEFWNQNYTLRFSQVLISMQIIQNYSGGWYYMEDATLFTSSGILKYRDVLFWGNTINEDKSYRKKIKFIKIKDLGTDHIRNILDDVKNIDPLYKDVLKKELKLRANNA